MHKAVTKPIYRLWCCKMAKFSSIYRTKEQVFLSHSWNVSTPVQNFYPHVYFPLGCPVSLGKLFAVFFRGLQNEKGQVNPWKLNIKLDIYYVSQFIHLGHCIDPCCHPTKIAYAGWIKDKKKLTKEILTGTSTSITNTSTFVHFFSIIIWMRCHLCSAHNSCSLRWQYILHVNELRFGDNNILRASETKLELLTIRSCIFLHMYLFAVHFLGIAVEEEWKLISP